MRGLVLCHRNLLIFFLFQILQFFLFLRFMLSASSRNQEARLLISSRRSCWIVSKSFEDVKITESSTYVRDDLRITEKGTPTGLGSDKTPLN